MILGSDWEVTKQLEIDRFRNIVLDLNGHTVKRDGKKKKEGNFFYLKEFSKLAILDSNPKSQGYNGIKGGVIAGGNGDSCGGCIELDDLAELDISGGTIYNCRTDKHGGAIYADNDFAKVSLKNCTFDGCRTEDSGDDCHGGALYIAGTSSLTIENVTFRNCYSEDDGGAIFLDDKPGFIRMTNVTFDKNEAKDRGGAIRFGSFDDSRCFSFEAVNCTFTNNKSGKDGGAVYLTDNDDSPYHYPVIFRNCAFTGNSGNNGSALKINDNSVLLTDCTVTGNKANGMGAVYVDNKWTLSVAGKTIIRDNINQNLVLDKDGEKTRIYPAGLTEGADIVINSTSNDKSTLIMKDVSRRQLSYFRVEEGMGELVYEATGSKEANLTFASLFGSGSFWVIAGVAAAAVAAAVIILVWKKKKRNSEK